MRGFPLPTTDEAPADGPARISSVVKHLIASGQFDVGLAADEIDVTGVDATLLMQQRRVIAVPAGHPLADRRTLHPADLHGMPFIALAPEDTARHRLDGVLAAHGVMPKIMLESLRRLAKGRVLMRRRIPHDRIEFALRNEGCPAHGLCCNRIEMSGVGAK